MAYRAISSDSHLEVASLFKHVPAQYRDFAPRLVNLPDGGHAWLAEGQPALVNTSILSAGRKPIRLTGNSYWDGEGRPVTGTGGPVQRLHEQNADGIDAEVLNT